MRYVCLDLDNTLTDRKATVSAYAEYFIADYHASLDPDVSIEHVKEIFNNLDNGGYESHEKRSKLISELEIWKKAEPAENLSRHWQN